MHHFACRMALVTLAAGTALFVCSTAVAHPDGVSIAVNFAADEPSGAGSSVVGAAGVLGTEAWNNVLAATGGPQTLQADNQGVAEASEVTIEWVSNNTWSSTGRGEENNTAPAGDDRNLMVGYLDTTDVSTTTVTVVGLETIVAEGTPYTVYAYMNGGVVGRGGDYTINGQVYSVVDNAAFDGTYVQGENYVVFQGITGDSFTLTAHPPTTALFRAPLNAIEVVLTGGEGQKAPLRTVTSATSADECPPNGRGPLAVKISQPLPDGAGAGDAVVVTEQATGPFDATMVTAQNGGIVTDVVDPAGVQITWNTTRGQLVTGVQYSIALVAGTASFSGTVGDEAIQGPNAASPFCDTRVTNLTCTANGAGGVDLSWDNHPFADPGTAISIQNNGVELATVAGTATAATVVAADLIAGINALCVVNSSGLGTCCTIVKDALILSDMLTGGDGTGTADPQFVGINPDTGVLATAYLNADVLNSGENPQAVDPAAAAYVDCVFIMDAATAVDLAMPINTEGTTFTVAATDVFNAYGLILKDVTHDVDKDITDIWAGGENGYTTCVAVHAAAGVTYSLAAIREDFPNLASFSCFAGTDQCTTSNLTAYVILSDDTEIVDSVSVPGLTANTGQVVELDIPSDALYLTLAVGAGDGSIACDHGVFADAVIVLGAGGPRFKRGDVNADSTVNIADAIALLGNLFGGQPAPVCTDAADGNDDGTTNIADAITILGHLFGGTGNLPPPFGACGEDPTDDRLSCGAYPPCR